VNLNGAVLQEAAPSSFAITQRDIEKG